ncbi:MAG: formate/nitrite transporter family protein [Thermovirgaceae bacterium]
MNFKSPVELAKSACAVAKAKSSWNVQQMLLMGILAGAYIAFGGFLSTVVTQDAAKFVGVGISKFLGGAVFSVGLMMVVIGGAELFTGNCLMSLGTFAGCQPLSGVVKNWIFVYLGNLLGSLLVAALIYYSGLWNGQVGVNALSIATGKMNLPIGQAFVRGILCNWIVVLAVWMSMAATDIVGKIFAIFFPIMTFVASGFEHSIANMYFMGLGMFLKGSDAVVSASGIAPEKLANVDLGGYLHNLIPVTLGNIVGGVLFVAVFYFLVFRNKLEDVK